MNYTHAEARRRRGLRGSGHLSASLDDYGHAEAQRTAEIFTSRVADGVVAIPTFSTRAVVLRVICGGTNRAISRCVLAINDLAERLIGLGIDVHRALGPGLSEIAYERALALELTAAALPYRRQIGIPVAYRGEIVAEYRPDFVVADLIVVEIKSVERLIPVHRAQMLTYLRVTGRELGLVMNFNTALLKQGVMRVVLQLGERTL